jgi:hypothetical protein
MDRVARAEQQSIGCEPTSERLDTPVDFPLQSAVAGERPLGFSFTSPPVNQVRLAAPPSGLLIRFMAVEFRAGYHPAPGHAIVS